MHSFFHTLEYKKVVSVLLFFILFAAPLLVFGQDKPYDPLAGIPGVNDRTDPTLVGYLNAIFMLSIAVAAVVAVLRILIAGFQYMLASDGWANKEEAKSTIWAVITGLVVLLLSYIILQQINPNLVDLRILK